jgi:hypothetical protein
VFVTGACVLPASSPTPAPTRTEPRTVEVGTPLPIREPGDLPRLPEERAVIEAIAAAGLRVDRVAVSKFEDHIFGERKRARVFGAPIEGTRDRVRVDVLFLDSPVGEVRICPVDAGSNEYSIVTDGRRVSVGSAQEIFFAVSDRLFVLASDLRVREALRSALDLTVPICP